MKKLISIFLMIQLVLTALPVVSSAKTDGVSLTIEQSDACVGDLIEVKVNLKNNPGIISASLKVSFTKNLKLVDAKNGDVFSTLTYVPPKALSNGIPITSESRFIWSGFDISDADIKNGTILTLYFRFTKGSAEPYQVSITSENGDIVDKELTSIVLNTNSELDVTYHKGEATTKNKKPATISANGYTGDSYCSSCNALLRKGKTINKIKSVSLSKKAYKYDGKAKKPSVTVKDSKNKKLTLNKDYKITYASNRKKVGTYKVTVKFKGNYSGSKTLNFTIYHNLTAPKKVTAELYGPNHVKVSWSKVANAKAYNVYYKKVSAKSYAYYGRTTATSINIPHLANGVNYTFKVVPCAYANKKYYEDDNFKSASVYTLKKVSTPKVTKASAGIVKVSWPNINGESGYEVSVSTSPSTTGLVYSVATNSKTVAVRRNTTYYYKVRAYKVVGGKRIYTDWSNTAKYILK